MLKKTITYFLRPRHPWRHIGFDELSELYTSTMLRSMGLSLIGIFVPIYLYLMGYPLSDVLLFMAFFFIGRVVSDVPAAYVVARIGPKHTMIFSYIFQILSLVLLLTLPSMQWPLWIVATVWGTSGSLYFIAYHVDFSKIIHSDHGGKELGFMTIVERVGTVLGPVVGGLVASIYGPQYTIAAAIVLLMLAIIPLLLTAEPIKTHQKLYFRHLPYKKLKRDFTSFFMLGMENTLTMALWPLYAAIIIFTMKPYASIGIVTSIGIVAAILSAHAIGKLVDKNQGRSLLNWSSYVNSFFQLTRPFVAGAGGVVAVNVVSEVVASGMRIPLSKGFYDRADSLPGQRIVYIVVTELMADVGKASSWLFLWLLSFALTDQLTMQIGFGIAAVASILITLQRFPALTKQA